MPARRASSVRRANKTLARRRPTLARRRPTRRPTLTGPQVGGRHS